jgi:uncharacterized damage-inducible protein DinB
MRRALRPPVVLAESLLQAFATNERINQYLMEHVPEAAWRAEPPGGKGRSIAAITAHIHNVRHMWLVAVAKDSTIPPKLEPQETTLEEARQALADSHKALERVLALSLAAEGRIRNFQPDVVGFVAYLIAHDAHHRGQICMLARQLGHTLPKQAGFGMWEWGKRGNP